MTKTIKKYVKKTDVVYNAHKLTDNTYDLSGTLLEEFEKSTFGDKKAWSVKNFNSDNAYSNIRQNIRLKKVSLHKVEEYFEHTNLAELPYKVIEKLDKHRMVSGLTREEWAEQYWDIPGASKVAVAGLSLKRLQYFITTTNTPTRELLYDEVEEFKIRL